MKIKNLELDFLPASPEQPVRQVRLPLWWALVFAALTAFLMPRQSAFSYAFQVGQPWNYHTLNAPFDFEVLYPEEQVQPAMAKVQSEHAPYFRLNNEVARQQKQRFSQLLEEQVRISGHDAQFDDLRANAGAYLNFGQQLLDLLFNRGIVDPKEPAFRTTPGYVYVWNGNTERQVPVRSLLTVTTAKDFLTDTLPFTTLRRPELVLPMLENVLVPNLIYSDSLTGAVLHHKLAAAMSTGITVHRGESLIQRNELVSNDSYLKLQSLARRYDPPDGWMATLGYGLLAVFAFMVYLLWFRRQYTGPLPSREAQLLPMVLAMLGILAVGFASRAGLPVPLLIPFWILPVLLRRLTGPAAGIAVWCVVMLLTTISLDWSGGWLVLQVAGLTGALLLLAGPTRWRARCIAVVVVALIQILAGVAAGWAGKIPDAVWTTDSMGFLFAGACGALLAFPLANLVGRQL
ncbi:MAG: hypothetical protein ABIO24_06560 [Saprospiraceae bacterium]